MAPVLRGVVVQAEVVHAIILRETRTRFWAQRLGYLWAIIEPVLVILTFYALFRLAGRTAPAGMDVWSFVATGLVPYRLFSSCAGRVAEAVNGNKAILYYPQVVPLDLALARGILETATFVAVFALLLGGHAVWQGAFAADSLAATLAGLGLAGLLGTTLGLVFCALGQVWPSVDRARGPLLRPLFWVSGVFFTAAALPENVRRVLCWNPVLHAVELVRAGWFEGYGADHADPVYALRWVLGLSLLGLLLERRVRRRIDLA
jgi:capsular polysaccharide transport system permease protein